MQQPTEEKKQVSSPSRGGHHRSPSAGSKQDSSLPNIPLNALMYKKGTIRKPNLAALLYAEPASPQLQELVNLFQKMYRLMAGLVDEFPVNSSGNYEGNEQDSLAKIRRVCDLIRKAYTDDRESLSIDDYDRYLTSFRIIKDATFKTEWKLFGAAPHLETNLTRRVAECIKTLEKNKSDYEFQQRNTALETKRKIEEEEAKQKAKGEEERKVKEEEAKRKESEEKKAKEDQLREQQVKLLQETLELQKDQYAKAEARREQEMQLLKQTLESQRKQTEALSQQTAQMKNEFDQSIRERDETIRELKKELTQYQSQASQSRPVPTQAKFNGIQDTTKVRDSVKSAIGDAHYNLLMELFKLRSGKMKTQAEVMIKSLLMNFKKPVDEAFFNELLKISLEAKDPEIHLLEDFRKNLKKYTDDPVQHDKVISGIISQSQATINANKPKYKEGTTGESNIYSKLGEYIDKVMSSPIEGLAASLKQQGQLLREAELKKLAVEQQKIPTLQP